MANNNAKMTKGDAAVLAWIKSCGSPQQASVVYQSYSGMNSSAIPADCVLLANKFADIWTVNPVDFYNLMKKIPDNFNSGPLANASVQQKLKEFSQAKGIVTESETAKSDWWNTISSSIYTPEVSGSTTTTTTPQTSALKIAGIIGLVGIAIAAIILVIFLLKK